MLWSAWIILTFGVQSSLQHARLMEVRNTHFQNHFMYLYDKVFCYTQPPSRASMWRLGFPTPKDIDDNQSYCGGYGVQFGESQSISILSTIQFSFILLFSQVQMEENVVYGMVHVMLQNSETSMIKICQFFVKLLQMCYVEILQFYSHTFIKFSEINLFSCELMMHVEEIMEIYSLSLSHTFLAEIPSKQRSY